MTRRIIDPTEKLVLRAAIMEAHGMEHKAIAKALRVTAETVRTWKLTHRDAWEYGLAETMPQIIAAVRRQMGTAMVDPDAYLTHAEAADQYLSQRGESLLPTSTEMTLTRFYETCYEPLRLTDAAKSSRDLFRIVLRRWALLTGDPPLAKIDNLMLARFRDTLGKFRGLRPGTLLGANTVRSFLVHIQRLLDLAGPPGPRRRDAVNLIATVPWCRPPRKELKVPKIASWDKIQAVYQEAATMRVPRLPGLRPGDWWQAVWIVALYVGLRRRTLFALRWADIDWDNHRLVIPGDSLKNGRQLTLPMHGIVEEHLRRIHTAGREYVFSGVSFMGPGGGNDRSFYTHLHRLEERAGIPPEEFIGLHALRRTLATIMAESNLTAAQFMLGHTASEITKTHYVNPAGLMARAVQSLPVPSTFRQERVSPVAEEALV